MWNGKYPEYAQAANNRVHGLRLETVHKWKRYTLERVRRSNGCAGVPYSVVIGPASRPALPVGAGMMRRPMSLQSRGYEGHLPCRPGTYFALLLNFQRHPTGVLRCDSREANRTVGICARIRLCDVGFGETSLTK